jgi:hypothetical protein
MLMWLTSTAALKIVQTIFHSVDILFFIEVKELIPEEFPQYGIELGYRFPQLPCISCDALISGCFHRRLL